MLSMIIAGVGLALKVAAPIFIPPLMQKLEQKLPNKGDGPKRRDAVLRAVRALAVSLENDGVLTAAEREDLYREVPKIIETFVPTMNAARQTRQITITGGVLEVSE